MRRLSEIWKFAFSPPNPPPPGPYEIALTFASALLSSGRFSTDDFGAAMDTAWTLVMPFYQGQAAYEKLARALFDMTQHASAPEPDMSAGEARAYVTGGETGDFGELAGPGMLEAVRARQSRIAAGELDPRH